MAWMGQKDTIVARLRIGPEIYHASNQSVGGPLHPIRGITENRKAGLLQQPAKKTYAIFPLRRIGIPCSKQSMRSLLCMPGLYSIL